VKFDVDDEDVRDLIVVNIRSQAQIRLAANVAGAQAGVHRDKKGNPYLVLQNHRLTRRPVSFFADARPTRSRVYGFLLVVAPRGLKVLRGSA